MNANQSNENQNLNLVNNNLENNHNQLFSNSNIDHQETYYDNGLYNQYNDVFVNKDSEQKVRSSVIEVEFNGTDSNAKKRDRSGMLNILANKNFLLIILMLVFVFTSITVWKAVHLKTVVDNYEEFFTVIEEKESLETVVYNDNDIIDENLKTGAVTELFNCIKSPLNISELPSSISSIINEINAYYNQSNNYFAFKYKDIYTGFSISYNENQQIFTASTIKAPKDIYLYEMASLGKINLSDKLMYTSKYYNTGSGALKNYNFDTEHEIKTLLKYSTSYSDNAAHNMLMDKYGRENMLNFWKEKGTNAIFTVNNNWGVTNAHDATIYMEELYRFYIENETYGQELMNNFIDAKPKFIKGKDDYVVANKSGWSGSAIHDVSIVFADNPYIVVALSNLGDTDYYMGYFNKANDFAYRLHTEYWKYKMDMCNDIEQY